MSKRNETVTKHYTANYDRLIKRCINRVPNKSAHLAEEVVQEAYARAMKYFRTFNWKINDFDVWFNSILKNAINDCRQIERERGVNQELNENIEDLSPMRVAKEMFQETEKRIISLSKTESERDILTLFFIFGYRSKEVSEYLAINHNTVRQMILRFRSKIDDFNQGDT